MSDSAPVSLSEYARLRGVSRQAVQRAIEHGRITRRRDGKLDPARADAEWQANTNGNLSRRPAAQRHRGGGSKGSTPGSDPIPPRADSERRIAFYKAEVLRLENEITSGRWIEKAEVERVSFAIYRQVRDKLLTVPDRVGPEVAGTGNVPLAIKLIRDDILVCLRDLSEGIFNEQVIKA